MSAEIKTEEQWEKEGMGIAGRQLVEGCGAIKGDLVISRLYGRFIESANYYEYSDNCVQRIYRKIPVAKQGDCDAPRIDAAKAALPTDAAARKGLPVATGFLDYFPDAVLAVARVSKVGNEQHHPGAPLHWDRSKSTDEADAAMRHFLQRGTIDSDGLPHTAKCAWRIMALLQKEIEAGRTKT